MCGGKRKREFPSQVAVAQKHIRNIYLASEFPYLGKNQTQRQRERGRQGWAEGERQIESECERETEGGVGSGHAKLGKLAEASRYLW